MWVQRSCQAWRAPTPPPTPPARVHNVKLPIFTELFRNLTSSTRPPCQRPSSLHPPLEAKLPARRA